MKQIFTVLLFAIFSVVFSQKMEMSPKTVDFGDLKKGAKAEQVIEIKNTGTAPLILSDVKPSCGCTIATWPKKPIMPGKSEKMTVNYDSNRVGAINKVIEVYSNDKEASRQVIRLKGNIKQ